MKKALLLLSLLLNVVLIIWLLRGTGHNPPEDPEASSMNTSERMTLKIVDESGFVMDSVSIVMLGNSITHAGNWQDLLNRDDVFNGGKPGWTSQQLSWVIKNFIAPHRPRLCFFKAGINDYTLGIGTSRIADNMQMILDSISGLGTVPVFTTTLYQRGNTFRNRQIDSLNAQMEAFCTERGYDFLDLRPFLCEDGDIRPEFVQADNTHLTPKAYPVWADALKPVIAKYE